MHRVAVFRDGLSGVSRTVLAWVGFGAACACIAPRPCRSEEFLTPPQPHYSGRLRANYDYRTEGDATDSDLYGYWYGNARDLAGGRLDFYTSGRLHNDLDSSSSVSSTNSSYRSLDDAGGVTEQRVLQAYLDSHDKENSIRLRLGRQYIDIADYLHLDGGQVMLFENEKLGGRIYFGQPVSYYTPISGDLAGGLSLVGRPWTGNRTRFTYSQYYAQDERESDKNYYVDLQQEVAEAFRTRTRLSVLNDEFRMASMDVSWFSSEGDTDVQAGGSYWGRFDARTRLYSPLYQQLGTQDPYTYCYARLNQQLSRALLLSPGVSFRMADSSSATSYDNRDYSDYDLTLVFEPNHAFSASLSLQYWDVQSGDSFVGLSGELRYRHGRIWEISAGSAYVDYTYDSYSDISYSVSGGQTVFSEDGTVTQKSPTSIAYLLRAKWNVTRTLGLRLQGDVEDDSTTPDLSFRGRGTVEVRF